MIDFLKFEERTVSNRVLINVTQESSKRRMVYFRVISVSERGFGLLRDPKPVIWV
jgi:hypothetical protein